MAQASHLTGAPIRRGRFRQCNLGVLAVSLPHAAFFARRLGRHSRIGGGVFHRRCRAHYRSGRVGAPAVPRQAGASQVNPPSKPCGASAGGRCDRRGGDQGAGRCKRALREQGPHFTTVSRLGSTRATGVERRSSIAESIAKAGRGGPTFLLLVPGAPGLVQVRGTRSWLPCGADTKPGLARGGGRCLHDPLLL